MTTSSSKPETSADVFNRSAENKAPVIPLRRRAGGSGRKSPPRMPPARYPLTPPLEPQATGLRNNRYGEAIDALFKLKGGARVIDMICDDEVISYLLETSTHATTLLVERYLRDRKGTYPTIDAVLQIMQNLEDEGVFGPGC